MPYISPKSLVTQTTTSQQQTQPPAPPPPPPQQQQRQQAEHNASLSQMNDIQKQTDSSVVGDLSAQFNGMSVGPSTSPVTHSFRSTSLSSTTSRLSDESTKVPSLVSTATSDSDTSCRTRSDPDLETEMDAQHHVFTYKYGGYAAAYRARAELDGVEFVSEFDPSCYDLVLESEDVDQVGHYEGPDAGNGKGAQATAASAYSSAYATAAESPSTAQTAYDPFASYHETYADPEAEGDFWPSGEEYDTLYLSPERLAAIAEYKREMYDFTKRLYDSACVRLVAINRRNERRGVSLASNKGSLACLAIKKATETVSMMPNQI